MKTRKAKRAPARIKTAARAANAQATLSAFHNLEGQIRDLERGECDNDSEDEPLALFAVEQVERHAAELRKQFYAAFVGKAVQS
jgi:hypothetical protein